MRPTIVTVIVACATLFVGSADAQDTLADWQTRQRQVRDTIERVRPCVVAVGGGSGVIVSADGIVLTVSHVTKSAGRRVKVNLPDGSSVMATTLGSDRNSDAAALQLDGPGPWPFVEVAGLLDHGPKSGAVEASDSVVDVKRGQWCLAFGYPLSFPRDEPAVVRMGRVTKLDVSKQQIVTDAPIMAGDSGGPLVDLDGRLIGISSRIKADARANISVPVDSFRRAWPTVVAGEDVSRTVVADPPRARPTRRAWLGVFGDTDEQRVRVRRVQPGSPAAAAGLKAEDVILEIDGAAATSFRDVVQTLGSRRPGDELTLLVNRYGHQKTLKAELGERP